MTSWVRIKEGRSEREVNWGEGKREEEGSLPETIGKAGRWLGKTGESWESRVGGKLTAEVDSLARGKKGIASPGVFGEKKGNTVRVVSAGEKRKKGTLGKFVEERVRGMRQPPLR